MACFIYLIWWSKKKKKNSSPSQISSKLFHNLNMPYLKLPNHLKAISVFLQCSFSLKSKTFLPLILSFLSLLLLQMGFFLPHHDVPNELYTVLFLSCPHTSCFPFNNLSIPARTLETMAFFQLIAQSHTPNLIAGYVPSFLWKPQGSSKFLYLPHI